MKVVKTIGEVRAARAVFPTLGLVPTMGFLHEGHASLIERAKAECGAVAVSIFVNPTQFGPSEDLTRYPRDLDRDLTRLRDTAVDLAFVPEVDQIYPAGFATSIDVGPLATILEGASRPGHFAGVATVVAKLFNIVQPTRAYFGQKDAQQCAVIRHMVRDLDLPVEIVVRPTIRDASGLAVSSRNSYLTPAEHDQATVLFRALSAANAAFAAGERTAAVLRAIVTDMIAGEPAVRLDYVSIADPESLEECELAGPGAVVSLAAFVGKTRLIDNLALGGA
jgi:pantoate--beta-alanine ligase